MSVDARSDREKIDAVTGVLVPQAAASGGVAPYEYSWMVAPGSVNAQYSLASADTMSPDFSADTPGDYILTLSVRDAKGSMERDDLKVRVIIPDNRVVQSELGHSLSACKSILMEAGIEQGTQVMLRAPVLIFGTGFSLPSGAILRAVSEADSWCTKPRDGR